MLSILRKMAQAFIVQAFKLQDKGTYLLSCAHEQCSIHSEKYNMQLKLYQD